MQAFTTLSGIMAPLDRIDVDTDQIIPKQYLKTIQRTGLKEGLFADWRQRPDGTPDPISNIDEMSRYGSSDSRRGTFRRYSRLGLA